MGGLNFDKLAFRIASARHLGKAARCQPRAPRLTGETMGGSSSSRLPEEARLLNLLNNRVLRQVTGLWLSLYAEPGESLR